MSWDIHLRAFSSRLCQMMADASSFDLSDDPCFNNLALELFTLQFKLNKPYSQLCRSRGVVQDEVKHWLQVPAVPAAAFKEQELSCIPPAERTAVFHSSGTTSQQPSRHFHNSDSLQAYEQSLTTWFSGHFSSGGERQTVIALTPTPQQASHSSLVHMIETLRRRLDFGDFLFAGNKLPDGAWSVDCPQTVGALMAAQASNEPVLMLGTAFSFVYLLDHMKEHGIRITLPQGSRLMETGGYKGRSRAMAKSELHLLIKQQLGVDHSHIISEYGMSELSSQAYSSAPHPTDKGSSSGSSVFRLPPWARAEIISPETGQEVKEGQTGLIRIFDLANVYSVMAVQT